MSMEIHRSICKVETGWIFLMNSRRGVWECLQSSRLSSFTACKHLRVFQVFQKNSVNDTNCGWVKLTCFTSLNLHIYSGSSLFTWQLNMEPFSGWTATRHKAPFSPKVTKKRSFKKFLRTAAVISFHWNYFLPKKIVPMKTVLWMIQNSQDTVSGKSWFHLIFNLYILVSVSTKKRNCPPFTCTEAEGGISQEGINTCVLVGIVRGGDLAPSGGGKINCTIEL